MSATFPTPACRLVVLSALLASIVAAQESDPALAADPPPAAVEPANQAEALRQILRQAMTNEALLNATNAIVLPAPPTQGVPTPTTVIRTPSTNNPAALPFPGTAPAQIPPRRTPIEPPPSPGTPAAAPTVQVPLPTLPLPGTPRPSVAGAVPGAVPGPGLETPTEEADPYIYTLKSADVREVLDEYAKVTGRTVLQPDGLSVTVTLFTQGNLNREEATQALQGALALNGITLIPQGEKFVKAVLMQNSIQEGGTLISKSDTEVPDTEEYVTQVAQLKVALPSEVAQLLQSFAKTPQGIVPIDSSMIVVIRDYASNVKRMLELIKRIDVEPETEYNLEVLPIRYGRVTDIWTTMNALISGTAPTPVSAQAGQTAGGFRSAGGFGAGSRMGSASGLRTTSRYGTGSGMGGQYPYNQYNQPYAAGQTPVGRTTTPAPGTTSASFQQRLNTILNRATGEEESQVLGDARIVPDERSNSLIVYANRQDMKMITNIVSKVDVLLAQVLIEGIVVAVALGDDQQIGVSWYQTPKRFGNDFSGAGAINNGFFGILTNFPSATPTGFSYWGRLGDDLNVAVTAFATDSKVRILQRPRIQTSHAVPGSFFSGSTVPYVTGFSDYYGGVGGTTRSQVQQIQVGVQLEVTPYITPDNLVVLDIYQDVSQLGEFVQIDQNDVPTTTSRTAAATLSVRDGETIMLGGYIEDSRTSGKSGVPLLKDIPGLGALFRSSSKKNSRAELILLLKVTVLKSPTEASALAEAERSLLPGLDRAQKEFDRGEAR